jgi:hypothetical protein
MYQEVLDRMRLQDRRNDQQRAAAVVVVPNSEFAECSSVMPVPRPGIGNSKALGNDQDGPSTA